MSFTFRQRSSTRSAQREQPSLPFGLSSCDAKACTSLEPGKVGKATIGGVYSRVLLKNTQTAISVGASIKVVGLHNSTTFLVEAA